MPPPPPPSLPPSQIYFTDLSSFSLSALEGQRSGLVRYLEGIAVGKAYKSRRRTVMRQIDKVDARLAEGGGPKGEGGRTCRSCGDAGCKGDCWGYFGLNRCRKGEGGEGGEAQEGKKKGRQLTHNDDNNKRMQKKSKVEPEAVSLGLNLPLSAHRDSSTKIRCVPPYLRTLTAVAKPRWAGAPLLDTLEAEFVSCKNRLSNLLALEAGLILVNGEKAEPDYKLKFQDKVSRLVHFHEPPVLCPSPTLSIAKVELPAGLGSVYCVSKPPTMPTHPAGQYLGNSMTTVAEAELGLSPGSLRPCHRLDKCTSGLVVCGADKKSVKAVLGRMDGGKVRKTYLARVADWVACSPRFGGLEGVALEGDGSIVVDRPIKCLDPQEGVRAIHEDGKQARTKFSLLRRCGGGEDLVLCEPATGRGHQIRVHLAYLGCPIVGDKLYGGKEISGAAPLEDVINAMSKWRGKEEASSAAVGICDVCKDGVERSFKSDQLLGHGSEIRLHAWKYCLDFGEDGSLLLEVARPQWGKDKDEEDEGP